MGTNQTTTGILDGAKGLTTDGILAGEGAGTTIQISSIAPDTVGDEGGWEVIASGSFPTDRGITVFIQDGGSLNEPCYSGVVGNGNLSESEDGLTLSFVVPPLPIGGPYTIFAISEDLTLVGQLSDALTVVHQSYTTTIFSYRRSQAAPRAVGPFDIRNEP